MRHRALKKKADYMLMGVKKDVALAEEKFEALKATLPSEMTLFKRTKNNRSELVLSVKPMLGTLLVVQ